MKVVVSSTFRAALRVFHDMRRVCRPVTRRFRPMLFAMPFNMLLVVFVVICYCAFCDVWRGDGPDACDGARGAQLEV